MDIFNSSIFHAQLEEMSERKARHYVLALARRIAGSIDRDALTSKDIVNHGRSLLERHTAEDSEILDDPVVKSFLRQVQCISPDVAELTRSCQVAAGKTLGWAYDNHPSVGDGGSDLYAVMKNNSLTPFSNFVSRVCRVGLERCIESTSKMFNFVEGGDEIDLYGIDIGVNFITTYEEQYKCYFTGDDVCRDVLITHDIESLISNIQSALKFELDRLGLIEHDSSSSMRDTHLFNSVIITRNGIEIIKFPLQADGYDQSVNPNLYGLKFRANINSDPAINYHVDLVGVEALEASAKELRIFAKSLPRHSALRLRGLSLEHDLGI